MLTKMAWQETIYNATVVLLSFNAYTWLCIIGMLIYINWRRTPHPKFPPGPKGVPLLGIVPFLSRQPDKDFKKWSLKYGPIMSVRLGSESVVILNNFDSVHEAFVQQGRSFADRPWIQLFCNTTKHNGIAFKKYGDDFKVQKHFALKYLREKGLGKIKMETVINDEGERLVRYLEKLQDTDIDFQLAFYPATANVIWKTVMGKRFDYEDPQFIKLLRTLKLILADPEHATRQTLIFIWSFLVYLPYFSATMNKAEERAEFILGKIQETLDEHKSRFDPENIRDYIDAFLLQQKSGVEGFTELQLNTACRDLFAAGTEPSSTTLSWLFVFYMNFPEHRKLIDQEIENVFGSTGTPTMERRAEMPFTCAFIQEGMRYRNQTPLGIQHCTTEEVKLQGYVIPKGTTVIANLQGVHMDHQDWPNPEHFDPYRHLDNKGRFVHSSRVIPFSIGSRVCIGEKMARVEIFVFFVKILQRFHVESASGRPPPLDRKVATVVVSPQHCVVRLTPRS